MTSKDFFQVGLPDGYREIFRQIREKIPEYAKLSDTKLTEKAIDLLWMKAKREIMLFTEQEIKYVKDLKIQQATESDAVDLGTLPHRK